MLVLLPLLTVCWGFLLRGSRGFGRRGLVELGFWVWGRRGVGLLCLFLLLPLLRCGLLVVWLVLVPVLELGLVVVAGLKLEVELQVVLEPVLILALVSLALVPLLARLQA